MQMYIISANDATKHQFNKITYRNTRPNIYIAIRKIDVYIYIFFQIFNIVQWEWNINISHLEA